MDKFVLCLIVWTTLAAFLTPTGDCRLTSAGQIPANSSQTAGLPEWMKIAHRFMNRIVDRFQNPTPTNSTSSDRDGIRNMITRLGAFGRGAALDIKRFRNETGGGWDGARNSTITWMERTLNWLNGR